jgi:homocysteine S-methyltransferase
VEGEALAELLAEFGLPGWLSFSCRDGGHTAQGEPFTQAAALAEGSSRVVAVGINCTPPPFVADLLTAARSVTRKPLLAYPNSGEGWDAANHCWIPGTDSTDFGPAARLWRDAGATILGGCCRTGPAEISQIRQVLLG